MVIRYVAKIEKQVLVSTRMFAKVCRTFVCRTCGRSSGDRVGQVVVCCSVGQVGKFRRASGNRASDDRSGGCFPSKSLEQLHMLMNFK